MNYYQYQARYITASRIEKSYASEFIYQSPEACSKALMYYCIAMRSAGCEILSEEVVPLTLVFDWEVDTPDYVSRAQSKEAEIISKDKQLNLFEHEAF